MKKIELIIPVRVLLIISATIFIMLAVTWAVGGKSWIAFLCGAQLMILISRIDNIL